MYYNVTSNQIITKKIRRYVMYYLVMIPFNVIALTILGLQEAVTLVLEHGTETDELGRTQ